MAFKRNGNMKSIQTFIEEEPECCSECHDSEYDTLVKQEYIFKIEFINKNFDETYLKKFYSERLDKNLRCASFIQSYNVLDCPKYFNCNLSL